MIIFGMILALKIYTLTLVAIIALGVISSITFVDPHESLAFALDEQRPDAYAEWDNTSEFTTTGTALARVVDHYTNIILQVKDGDIVSVEYTYSQVLGSDKHEDKMGVGQEKTISNSLESPVMNSAVSPIVERPDAYPEWGADVYASTDTAVARVTDPFMNAEPNKIETLTASIVVADDYDDGIKIILTETGANTGIFEEIIYFTETEESSGNMIKVVEGDSVSLDYMYSEVPGSDKREYMIEVGDEITIHNSQDIRSVPDTSGFGATVHLDKEIYSWTDKVRITVTSPFHNFDSNVVEEIGATQPYMIRMHTSSSNIDSYKLVETGPNTGIFAGEIILTGFLHDADGSGTNNDHLPYEDTAPMTSGSGPVDGFLENSNNDAISVQFDYSEDVTIVGYAEIQWNTGKIQWLEASYPDSGTGVVRVVDPDMNWDPEAVDNFDVDVWSDSDANGIDLTMTETNANTGVFEGTIFFSTTDESSGHKLRVAEGDTMTAEYEDNTLPSPYSLEDELDISDTAIIRNTAVPSPYKQMKNGVMTEHVVCNETFEKIYKSDGNPACVHPSSVDKLLERGYSSVVPTSSLLDKSLDEFTISDTLKETIRERVDNGTHQSLFVGIIDKNGIEQYYYGNTAKDGTPIDENTVFEIGSISKVLTSLILADMVVNGEVSLDDSIDQFLPENVQTPSFDGHSIALLDLATHTSGLPVMPNYPPNPDLDKEYEFNKAGLYEYLSDFEIHREIGSQYEYSNTGGSLLGHVLSLQSGKSYEMTLKERVLDKLGMDSTCVHQCDEIRDQFAKPHALGELVDEVGLDDDMAGAGGVKSSGKDMLTFLSYAMDFEDSEMRPAFELTQTANHQINEMLFIGLGWHMIDDGERNIVSHNGATNGFASFVGFDSDSNEGVVVLTNSQVLVDEIGLDILDYDIEELINSFKN